MCLSPLNVDNVDLHATGKPPANADRWTDSTLTLIRFEVNEMMRTIWYELPSVSFPDLLPLKSKFYPGSIDQESSDAKSVLQLFCPRLRLSGPTWPASTII